MAQKKSKSSKTATPAATADAAGQYVVLARKYRPQTFDDLIGQEAMVTTLRNAFATDRIAQGYMLTGVRGVGKTTTARILARALNYSQPADAEHGPVTSPTIDMPVLGEHCAAIMESRHGDVLEMDAASNTGIDNIREIIESARYKPMLARYKVYIIDEVHMLSKGAFNALLKTLEEPPPHVKFIFATTEIRKVPVTVLSRCQRFDLRRVDVPELTGHFEMICGKEGASADQEALSLIARAAEGSVRDGLSILDQAIASSLSAGKDSDGVSAVSVRAMLGLADRGRIFDLLDHLFGGDAGKALADLSELHRDGAEASQVISDLLAAVHITARVKTVGSAAAGEGISAEEERRATALAENLSMALLSRAWQMLLRGLEDVDRAPNPLAAAEMVLIRLAYTADLPSPDEIIKALGTGAGTNTAKSTGGGTSKATAGAVAENTRNSSAQTPTAEPAPAAEPASSPQQEPAGQSSGAPPWGDDDSHSAPDAAVPPASKRETPTPADSADVSPRTYQEVIDLAGQHRDAKLVYDLEENISLVRFEPGKIDLHLLPAAHRELANELREKLNLWTKSNWIIALSNKPGDQPIGEVKRASAEAEIAAIREHPAVARVLEEFPDAEIKKVQSLPDTAAPKDRKAGG